MIIEGIRTVVVTQINAKRLQIKTDGQWKDVPFVDADTLDIDGFGVFQEKKRIIPTDNEVNDGEE